MSIPRWRFVNRANPSESIAVVDFESAKTLARILQNAGAPGQWYLQEEIAIEALGGMPTPGPKLEARPAPEQVTAPPVSAMPAKPAIPERPVLDAEPTLEVALTQHGLVKPAPLGQQARPAQAVSSQERFIEEQLAREDLIQAAQEQEVQVQEEQAAPEQELPPPIFTSERRSGKRRYHRYQVEFRVILVSGGKSFRTFSSDVSVGGMLLKQKIPAGMLDRVCTIFIGSKTGPENIELKCKIVGDPANPSRIAFIDCDVPTLRRLENWVLHAGEQRRATAAA